MAEPPPRVFVSHSSADNAWCREFVAALQAAKWDVWSDEKGLGGGAAWVATIEREIEARDTFLLVLTPEAWASEWVRKELNLAQVTNRRILPVLHKPTQVDGFIRTIQWIDVVGLPGAAAATKVGAALGASPAAVTPRPPIPPPSPSAAPQIPPDRFPPRLAQLGYQGLVLGGVEVIVPPTCDVPAGAFLMGSDPAHDTQLYDEEKPRHWVALPAFQIARHAVTVAEYACFVRAAGRAKPKSTLHSLTWRRQLQRPDHPVVNVSWHDAAAYAAWLAKATGRPWRLPSEAEWEKAARWDPASRVSRIYPWGDAFDPAKANTREGGKGTTTPVGSCSSGASPCGAQDMAGDAWEWTSSAFKPYPYDPGDGRESANSDENRVLRGGTWTYGAKNARGLPLPQPTRQRLRQLRVPGGPDGSRWRLKPRLGASRREARPRERPWCGKGGDGARRGPGQGRSRPEVESRRRSG